MTCFRRLQMISGSRHWGPQLDVWAAGVVLYVLIFGGFPFLHPAEESLGRIGRLRTMAPRILAGTFRPLPLEVRH